MPELDEFALAKLAREMAMAVRSYKDIFKDFEINEEDYYEIEKNAFYQRAKVQFALEWNSALSATERVKVISASYLEQVLPVLGAKALDRKENLGAATDVAKFFAKNAGIGESKAENGKSAVERFVITINLGDDSKTYNKPVTIEGSTVDLTGEQNVLESAPNQDPSTDFFGT